MTTLHQNTPGELALPRPPGVIRRWLATHPKAVDWIIVACYLFGVALMFAFELLTGIAVDFFEDIDPEAAEEIAARTKLIASPWLIVMLMSVAVVAFALRMRRRYPLAGLVAISAIMFFDLGLLIVPNVVAQVFLLYAVPIYRGVRAAWVAYSIAVLSGALLVFLTGGGNHGLIGPNGLEITDGPFRLGDQVVSIMNALWLLVVLMVGINLGNRRRYVNALIERAHQLAREREQKAQLAVSAERNRIAREMHDIVAHSLSVVVTLSEAASVAIEAKPEAAKEAMQRAAETGRNALVEMRRLLGVLDDAEAASPVASPTPEPAAAALRSPQPGVAQLQQLVESMRQTGLNVTVVESGTPSGDASQQLAVYRIVQEGLTNVLRYAGRGAMTELLLDHTADGTHIMITDSGRSGGSVGGGSPAQSTVIPGSGNGLKGATERARLFGGSLHAGPLGRGWRLTANVPTGYADTIKTVGQAVADGAATEGIAREGEA